MTVIAAIKAGKSTWIGSDTLAVNNGTKFCTGPKWRIANGWAVGAAGDLRTHNLIAVYLGDLTGGLVGAFDFTQRMRGLLERDGYNTDKEEGPAAWGQQIILAHKGGVWSIGTCFSIVEIPEGELWADGSGRAYALGAGHVAKGTSKQRIASAIEAAMRYDSGCGGEVFMAKLS